MSPVEADKKRLEGLQGKKASCDHAVREASHHHGSGAACGRGLRGGRCSVCDFNPWGREAGNVDAVADHRDRGHKHPHQGRGQTHGAQASRVHTGPHLFQIPIVV
jgi:hypothetical protein